MADPLSEVITLLRPSTVFSKGISGAGRWGVRYSAFGQPSFSAVLEGRCLLAVDGEDVITLEAGDFVLLPATPGFTMSGFEPVAPVPIDPKVSSVQTGEVRHGTRGGAPDVRLLGGYFVFDSPDAALLVSLLPALVHVRGAGRLSALVRLVSEESKEQRSGRDLVLTRLVEVLLVEALRAAPGKARLRDCCAGWPIRNWRWRSGICTVILRARGRWPSLRRRPRFRAQLSSSASRAR